MSPTDVSARVGLVPLESKRKRPTGRFRLCGFDRSTHERCEGANVFRSFDDLEMFCSEFLHGHSALAHIEEADIVRSYDEIGRRRSLSVLDVDSFGRRYDGERFLVDDQSSGQVRATLDGIQGRL